MSDQFAEPRGVIRAFRYVGAAKPASDVETVIRGLDGYQWTAAGCEIRVVGLHAAPSGVWIQLAFDAFTEADVVLRLLPNATAADAIAALNRAAGRARWPHVIEVAPGERPACVVTPLTRRGDADAPVYSSGSSR